MNMFASQRGSVLLSVVVAITLLAAISYMLSFQGAGQANMTSGEVERDRLRYIAEAGVAHARLQLAQNTSCNGYTDIPKTDFAGDSYSVSFNTTKDSPVKFGSTAESQSGAKFKLKVDGELAYQPPVAIELQLSKTGGKDAILDDFYANRNYGGANYVQIQSASWQQRPVLQFDLSSIPAGVKIVSAQLELLQQSMNKAGAVAVHRMTRDWVEGTRNGGGTSDGADWQTHDGTSSWAQLGGEFDATVYGVTQVSGAKSGGWVAWDIGDLVQEWVSGTSPNYGLLLAGDGTVTGAKYASKDTSDPLQAPKLTIAYACECGKVCGAAPPAGKNVLLVVADAGNPSTSESDRMSLIESWGHTVTLISDHAPQADFNTALADADVAYIAGSGSSDEVGTKLTAATVGVISEDIGLVDELGIAEPAFLKRNSQSINVTDNTHYVTDGFGLGTLQLYTYVPQIWTVTGALAPGLQVLGETQDGGSSFPPGLAVLEAGAVLWGGGSAAGRRVQVPWSEGSFDINALNDDGKTIMQRAIEWGALPPPACEADYSPTAEVAQYATGDYASNAPEGITYISEGTAFNGVEAPTGGALISVDSGVNSIFMTDLAGSLLTSTSYSVLKASGVTHVTTGQYADHLAIADSVGALVYYIDMSGSLSGSMPTSGFGATEPAGVAFIETSSTGTYDERLLIADNGSSKTVYIVTQLGASETSINVDSATGEKVSDVAHLPGTDKFIVTYDTIARIYGFDGSQLREYSLSTFGTARSTGVVIQPLTCQHIVTDKSLDQVKFLDDSASPGPIAHWKLDDGTGLTAVDSIGGHDGTLTNMTASSWDAVGQIDGALRFPGNDDYVNVPHDDALSLTNMTISLWLKTPTLNNVYQTMVRKKQQANYQLTTWEDEIVFAFNDGSGMKLFQTTNANLTTNAWHHVVATLDDTTGDINVYVDGNPNFSATTPYHPLPNTEPLTLGGVPDSSTYWPGMLDDIRLYDYPLTATQVSELFTAGSGGGGGGGGGSCVATYADDFESNGYAGSTGTRTWATDWLEINESDGSNRGDEIVANDGTRAVRIRDNDGGGEGVQREADLSGYASATLNLEYKRNSLDNANDYVTVDVSGDGGSTWHQLAVIAGPDNDSDDVPASYPIPGDRLAANSRIRFLSSPNMGNTDKVWFDNVEICLSN